MLTPLALAFALTALPSDLPPPSTCVVTSTADAGAGSLRAAVEQSTCPLVTFDVDGPIVLTWPIHVARTVTIAGAPTDTVVPGTSDVYVGTAGIPLDPVAWPSVEIINAGPGDGLYITGDGVELDHLAIRGTSRAGGYADITAVGVDVLTVQGVVAGLDRDGGLVAPPVEHRTGNVPLVQATGSTNVRLERSAFGWNGAAWGAVGMWGTTNSHLYRSFIAGAGGETGGTNTLDAFSAVFGSDRVTVRESLITDSWSSSAVELHSASRVIVDDSTFRHAGRAGVTVFDSRDVSVAGVVIEQAGTCGASDAGGVMVYGGSERVQVSGSSVSMTACPASLPAFSVAPGSDGQLR